MARSGTKMLKLCDIEILTSLGSVNYTTVVVLLLVDVIITTLEFYTYCKSQSHSSNCQGYREQVENAKHDCHDDGEDEKIVWP